MKEKLLISVSAGRSSGMMAYLLWTRFRDKYDMLFVFANTGREREETLVFCHNLTVVFGIPIVWIEAVVHHGKRKSCTHKIVDFETANRNGDVFEEVIKKYTLPSPSYLHCTRELKARPIKSYARSIWGKAEYKTVIGYRADEPKRVNLIKAKEENQYYPLWEWGIKKPDVAAFWNRQSFDLGLQDYQGNCKHCYKKADWKLIKQKQDDPSDNWIETMEKRYENHTNGREGGVPVRFFRHNRTLHEIIDQYGGIDKAIEYVDKSLSEEGAEFDYELMEQNGCEESCEPF